MLTKLKLALAIAAPLVAGATYAVAGGNAPGADQGQRRADMIQKFDQNGDGVLDDAERAQMKAAFQQKHAERRAAALAKYDTNKDGKLEPGERAVMRDDKLTARFQKLDKNGDGAVTLAEFKAGAPEGHRHGRHGHGRMRGADGTRGGKAGGAE